MKFKLWSSVVISLGTIVGGVLFAEDRLNQANDVVSIHASIRATNLLLQTHARSDFSIRVIHLETKDTLTPSERHDLLFFKDQMAAIDLLIIGLSR